MVYKKIIKQKLKINIFFLKEILKLNKVSYYYENIDTGYKCSFFKNLCFYSASTIKILTVVIMFRKILNKEYSLYQRVLITMEDLKQDTGIIKYQKKNTKYTIEELLKYTIIESDNTAYLKLVDMIGKDNIRKYGRKLGAKYTMQGVKTDSFGITNVKDMIIYLKEIKKFIDENNRYSKKLENWLVNPTLKLIDDESINNNLMVRKYGSYDVAYHECGYVLDDSPYFMIIFTQLNKKRYKKEFINKAAKMINKLNEIVKE